MLPSKPSTKLLSPLLFTSTPTLTNHFPVLNANDVAVGVIIAQLDNIIIDYPIAYYSKLLYKTKSKYSVTKKKCLAVLLAINYLRSFLYGTPFTVVTDCFSLVWL